MKSRISIIPEWIRIIYCVLVFSLPFTLAFLFSPQYNVFTVIYSFSVDYALGVPLILDTETILYYISVFLGAVGFGAFLLTIIVAITAKKRNVLTIASVLLFSVLLMTPGYLFALQRPSIDTTLDPRTVMIEMSIYIVLLAVGSYRIYTDTPSQRNTFLWLIGFDILSICSMLLFSSLEMLVISYMTLSLVVASALVPQVVYFYALSLFTSKTPRSGKSSLYALALLVSFIAFPFIVVSRIQSEYISLPEVDAIGTWISLGVVFFSHLFISAKVIQDNMQSQAKH